MADIALAPAEITVDVPVENATQIVADKVAPTAQLDHLVTKPMVSKNKTRSPPAHPPFLEMISGAIVSLKEKTGSSQYAITKVIEEKHKELPPNIKKSILFHLKKLVASGALIKVKSSFKLALPKLKASSSSKSKTVSAKVKTITRKPKSVTVNRKTVARKAKSVSAKPEVVAANAKLMKKAVARAGKAEKSKLASENLKIVSKAKLAVEKPKVMVKVKATAPPKSKAAVRPNKSAKTTAKSAPGKKVCAPSVSKKAPAKVVKKPKSVKSHARKTNAKKGRSRSDGAGVGVVETKEVELLRIRRVTNNQGQSVF